MPTIRNREEMQSLLRDSENCQSRGRSRGRGRPEAEWGGSCGRARAAPRDCCAAQVYTGRAKVSQVSAGTCELQEL